MVQRTRWVVLAAAVLSIGASAGALDEPDTLVAAKLVSVKPGTLVRFVAKGSFPLPAAVNAPTVAGASLEVFDTLFGGAGTATFDLPAGGWQALGVAAGTTGYRFRGAPGDDCSAVLIKQGYLKAVCRGAAVTLTPPFTGDVGVILTAGTSSKRYCAQAGGTGTNTATLTRRRSAPAPAECPAQHLGSQRCELDVVNTRIGFNPQPFSLDLVIQSAAIDISCGPQDGGGVADCNCAIDQFAPINIPSIGDVCIDNAGACGTGTLDCNGGNPRDVDLVADHDIGGCAGAAVCGASCASYCAGLGSAYEVRDFDCQGFCHGGSNADAACSVDSECPGGICGGNDTPANPGRCSCDCVAGGLGAASPPGTLACDLGLDWSLDIPGDGDCADTRFFASGPRCVPFTTSNSTAVILNTNDQPGLTIPASGPGLKVGVAVSCEDFAAGNLTGLTLDGPLSIMHTVVGNLLSHSRLTCQ